MRSISMDNDALRTEIERMSEKLKYMEGRRQWNSAANKKQYLHQVRVRQLCVEDVRKQLEKHFGSKREVPQKIEEVIKLGEKEIDERIKMLRMADKVSWLAAEKYVADLLCDNDEDDRRWKQAIKEAKEEQAKRKNSSSGYHSRNRGRDSFWSGGRSYRRDSRDRRSDRYVEDVGDGMEGICSGERPGPVTVVERRGTLRRTVGSPGKMESCEEEAFSTDKRVFKSDVPNMCNTIHTIH